MLVVNKLGEKNAREINEELTRAVLGCYCSDLIDDGILRRGKGGVIAWYGVLALRLESETFGYKGC